MLAAREVDVISFLERVDAPLRKAAAAGAEAAGDGHLQIVCSQRRRVDVLNPELGRVDAVGIREARDKFAAKRKVKRVQYVGVDRVGIPKHEGLRSLADSQRGGVEDSWSG